MLKAEEARALVTTSKASLESDLEMLDHIIREAAAKGETKCRVPYIMTYNRGFDQFFKNPEVEKNLISNGYIVAPRYEDKQLADMWIEISWEFKNETTRNS